MRCRTLNALILYAGLSVLSASSARADVADLLPTQAFESAHTLGAPVANAAFAPGEGEGPVTIRAVERLAPF
jgi:hypothetical protein